MIEELFILNERGDVLASKVYNSEGPIDTAETAFAHMHEAQSPRFSLGALDRTFQYVRANDVILCASQIPSNAASAETTLDLLLDIARVLSALLQGVSEASVVRNPFLVQEVVEETLFLGMPACLSVHALRSELVLSCTQDTTSGDTLASKVGLDEAVSRRAVEVRVTDCIRAMYSAAGVCEVFVVSGIVECHTTKLHLQEIHIAVQSESAAGVSRTISDKKRRGILESAMFDAQVNVPYFDKHRILKFKSVEDEMELMKYASSEERTPPMDINCTVKKGGKTVCDRYDVLVVLRTRFAASLIASNVEIVCRMPKSTEEVTCDCRGIEVSKVEDFSFETSSKVARHAVGDVKGGDDLCLKYRVRSAASLRPGQSLGTVTVDFDIYGLNVSNVRATSIKLSSEGNSSTSYTANDAARNVVYATKGSLSYCLAPW